MTSLVFQKLFVLVTGTPADTSLAPALETRVSHEGWGSLIADVNGYLTAQAQARGGAVLVQEMAMNGLGLHLGDADAAAIAASVSSGATTWADLLAFVIVQLQGPLGETLANRAEAAAAFTDALLEQDKDGLYQWNGGPNLNGAAHNLLQSIGADDLTFEQGMDSLLELVNNLSESGLGGVGSDGRISGATVFVDANGNGLFDDGEQVGTTGADGSFDVETTEATGTLMLMGGTDILSVNAFVGVMQAPAGATVITPLTSLAEALIDIDEEETALGASGATTAALGLPPINVLNYDPIAVLADPESTPDEIAQALAVERVSIQLMNLVSHLTVALMDGGMDEDEAGQAAWAAVAQAAADGTLDLTDADSIEDIFTGAGVDGDDSADIAEVVAALNGAADDADNIVDLAKVAVVAGDSAEELEDALDEGEGLDGFVDDNTGDNLDEAIDEADPGFLLPGIPVDGEGSPNIPPTGADGSVTVDEDASYAFTAEDFGYSDANGDELAAVRIDTVPAAGSLMLDGVAVVAGQLVAAEDIALLSFAPAADASGSGYASFTFSVQDEQGAFDTAPRTMTVDVTPVNDAPSGSVWIVGMEIEENKLFAQHDLVDVEGLGTIRFEWFADGEPLGKFGSSLLLTHREVGKVITVEATYTDGGGTFEAVMSGPSDVVRTPNNAPEGTVTISGTPTQNETLTASHDVTDLDGIGEISWQWFADGEEIDGATGEDYVLTNDEVGKEITVELRYIDLEGYEEAVESEPTDAVANVNDAPTLTTVNEVAGTEDTTIYFGYEDLAAAADEDDIDGDTLSFVVQSLGEDGTLEMWDGEDWQAVQAGATISGEDDLRWTPDENLNGSISAFSIRAHDGLLDSGEDVPVFVNVTPVNDAPTLTDVTVLADTNEDVPFEITYEALAAAADEADVDGDALTFVVGGVVSGTLQKWDALGEDWVTAGEDTTLAAGEKLRWTGDANANGTDLDAFTVHVDDGEDASSPDVLVEVYTYAVNDAPTLSTVGTLSGNEDTPISFTYADVAASADEADIDSGTISFRVEAISSGSLQQWTGEDWAGVSAGTTIDSGETFRWIPAANVNGNGIDAFTIVAWDGALASSPAVQVEANLTAVNDAPTLSTMSAFSGTEDTDVSFTLAGLAANGNEADIDSGTIQFRVEAISGGTLYKVLAGEDTIVSAGEIFESSETFRWTPTLNANGSGVDAFTVVAWDGALASSSPVQVEVNLTAVNDAPTLTSVTALSGSEDTPLVITHTNLATNANDADVDGDALSFRIEGISSGTLQIWTGEDWAAASVGTIVDAGEQLRWTPAANVNGNGIDAFTIVAWDGALASSGAVQVDVDVAAVNDAPTLDATKSPVLTSVTETVGTLTPTAPTNGSTTGATQISSLVAEGSGIANVSDIDSDTHGIAITAFDAASQGSMWYSTNGGTSWTELTTASAAAALLLDSDDYLFFKPDGGITPQTLSTVFTFKSWDQSAGTSGSTGDTTTGTAFSSATDTVAVTITAAPAQSPVNNGTTFGDGIDDLYYGGSGNDTIVSGTGNDTLYGGGGNDIITSENGSDSIDGGDGNDTLNAGNDGDTVYGGNGDDSILGGNAVDIIRGGAGNDIINGGNSGDTLMFEATAAGNGVDSITTTIDNNNDVLSFPNTLVTAGIEAGGGAFSSAITPFTTGSNSDTNIAGKIATYAGAALGDVETAAQVAALFQTDDWSLGANGKAVVITGTTADNTAYVWYVVNDGTAAVAASEVTLVGVLAMSEQLDDFDVTNFAFYTP